MNIPTETKPALFGAAAGALLISLAGFGWAGWTTASKADGMAVQRSDDAVVAALAPVCAERFERDANVATHRAALKAADRWSRSDVIERGGWAAIEKNASSARHSAVARACASLLVQD